MSTVRSSPLELAGEFRGFIRNAEGKRRLVLGVGDGEHLVKVSGLLRDQLPARLVGQSILIRGEEETKSSGEIRLVARELFSANGQPLPAPRPESSPVIRVCLEKHCWKRGARELWRDLERELAAAGLDDRVKLQPADCLDHCKRGPNLLVDRHVIEGGNAATARALVTQIAAEAPRL